MNSRKNEVENLYKALEIRDHAIMDLESQVKLLRRTSQNDILLEELEVLRHENISYREMISDLQNQLNHASGCDRKTHMEINYLKEEFKKQEEHMNLQLQTMEEKENELNLAKVENRNLMEKRYSLEMEIENLKNCIDVFRRNERDLISRLDENAYQNAKLDESYYSLKKEADEFQRLFEDANIKCVGIERENNLLYQKLQSLQKRLCDSENAIASLIEEHVAESRELREEIETLRKVHTFDEKNNDVARQHNDLMLEIGILESQLISCQAENRSLRRFHDRHHIEMSQVKDDYEECLRDIIKKERIQVEENSEKTELMSAKENQLRQDCLDLNKTISDLKLQLESSEKRNSYYEDENGLREFVFQHKFLESEVYRLREQVKELLISIGKKDDQINSFSKNSQHLIYNTNTEIPQISTKERMTDKSNLSDAIERFMDLLYKLSADIGFDEENKWTISTLQALDILEFIVRMKVTIEPRKKELIDKIANVKALHRENSISRGRIELHNEKVDSFSESRPAASASCNIFSLQSLTSNMNIELDKNLSSISEINKGKILIGRKTTDVQTATNVNIFPTETKVMPMKNSFVQVNTYKDDAKIELEHELSKTKEALRLCERKIADSESNVKHLNKLLVDFECKSKCAPNFAVVQSTIKELNELLESKTQLLEKYRNQKNATCSALNQLSHCNCVALIAEKESECVDLRKYLAESKTKNHLLEQNLANTNQTMINLRNDYKHLMENIEVYEKHAQQKDDEIARLREAHNVSEGRLSICNKKIKKLKECLQQQMVGYSKVEAVEASLKSTKAQLNKIARSKEMLVQNLQSANDKMMEYERKVLCYEKDIIVLKSNVDILRNFNRKLQKKLQFFGIKSDTKYQSSVENELLRQVGIVQNMVQQLDDQNANMRKNQASNANVSERASSKKSLHVIVNSSKDSISNFDKFSLRKDQQSAASIASNEVSAHIIQSPELF